MGNEVQSHITPEINPQDHRVFGPSYVAHMLSPPDPRPRKIVSIREVVRSRQNGHANPVRMWRSYKSNATLFGRYAWRSLVMCIGILILVPRFNCCDGGLVNEYVNPMCVQEVEFSDRLDHSGGEKHGNLLMINMNLWVYVCPLSTTTTRDRRL